MDAMPSSRRCVRARATVDVTRTVPLLVPVELSPGSHREYGSFTKVLGGTIVPLGASQRLNPLDTRYIIP